MTSISESEVEVLDCAASSSSTPSSPFKPADKVTELGSMDTNASGRSGGRGGMRRGGRDFVRLVEGVCASSSVSRLCPEVCPATGGGSASGCVLDGFSSLGVGASQRWWTHWCDECVRSMMRVCHTSLRTYAAARPEMAAVR